MDEGLPEGDTPAAGKDSLLMLVFCLPEIGGEGGPHIPTETPLDCPRLNDTGARGINGRVRV